MKKIAFWIIILCISSLFAQANGEMWEVDGRMVLRVWGTHYERGYAQGYFLAEPFVDVFENYMFNYACYGNPTFYNQARMLFENSFVIEDNYMTEAQAMIEGAIDSGQDMYFEPLDRELDANDILMANALIDLSGLTRIPEDIFACSSISSWGTSTENDEVLQGGLVITRMMDWATNAALFRNPLVLVSIPSEEDEQNWVSITFPGLFGGLSAINDNGLTTFLDMGNNHSCNDNSGFYPILLTLRNGIEQIDYDEDGIQTPQDIVQAVEDRNRAIGTIVHVTLDSEHLPVVIENNNAAGVSVRDVDDNTVVPGDNLVATNHFRTLYSPAACSRYNHIVDSLEVSTEIDDYRSWDLLSGAAGVTTNIHAIRYNSVNRKITFASAQANHPAYGEEQSVFILDDLFEPNGIEDQTVSASSCRPMAYPNPFNPSTEIRFYLAQQSNVTLDIFNVRGQRVMHRDMGRLDQGMQRTEWNAEGLSTGVYLCRVRQHRADGSTDSIGKMMLLQ